MATNEGWIKVHRSIREHWITQNANYYRAWGLLLMAVNYAPTKTRFNGEWITLKAGEMVTSYEHLAGVMMLSKAQTRRFIELLKEAEMVHFVTTRRGAHLTVCNYSTYQESRHTGKHTDEHTDEHTNEHYYKKKEVKNTLLRNVDMSLSEPDADSEVATKPKRTVFVPPDYETCRQYAIQRGWPAGEAQRFYDYQQATGWKVGNKPMKDWQAAMRTWERNLPPLWDNVDAYFQQILHGKQSEDDARMTAQRFFQHYQGRGWTTGTGQRITDYRPLAIKWVETSKQQ